MVEPAREVVALRLVHRVDEVVLLQAPEALLAVRGLPERLVPPVRVVEVADEAACLGRRVRDQPAGLAHRPPASRATGAGRVEGHLRAPVAEDDNARRLLREALADDELVGAARRGELAPRRAQSIASTSSPAWYGRELATSEPGPRRALRSVPNARPISRRRGTSGKVSSYCAAVDTPRTLEA